MGDEKLIHLWRKQCPLCDISLDCLERTLMTTMRVAVEYNGGGGGGGLWSTWF